MLDPGALDAPLLGVTWAAATLRALAARGLRRILLTSAARDRARAAPQQEPRGLDYERNPGRFVIATAAALASSLGEGVLVVLAGEARGDVRHDFGSESRPGLWELAHELDRRDLGAPAPDLGLGDWLEILSAQERTGELVVREGRETFLIRLERGSIHGITCPAPDRDLKLVAGALRARVSRHIVRLIETRRPEIRFVEVPRPASPLHRTAQHAPESCLDRLFRGPLDAHLRRPYLNRRLAGCLTDTPFDNLKLLAAGPGDGVTPDLRRPLEVLLRRIGRGFGVVLIGAAPVSAGGATEVLARIADTVLLVSSPADSDSARVHSAVESLRRGGAALVGVLAHHGPSPAPAPPPRTPARRR